MLASAAATSSTATPTSKNRSVPPPIVCDQEIDVLPVAVLAARLAESKAMAAWDVRAGMDSAMSSATAKKILLMGSSLGPRVRRGSLPRPAHSDGLSGHLTTKPLDRQARQAVLGVIASERTRASRIQPECQSVARQRSCRLPV